MTEKVEMSNQALFEIECAICYELFEPTTSQGRSPILMANCGHTFCKNCIS